MDARRILLDSFRAAVDAADPLRVVAPALPDASAIAKYRRTLVVGAGKAAASMAMAVERHWPVDAPLDGLVVTRYAHGLPCRRVEVIEAGHPVPDEAGERAAAAILERARALGDEDLLVVLASGGGSSLLSLPVETVSMADLKSVTKALLASGAPIQDMNVVRKHLSRIHGGRLASQTRAGVLALMISDGAGDEARMLATAAGSLGAAAAVFAQAGVRPVLRGDTVTGEARDVAQVMAAIAREILRYDQPFARPVALISGGECTVTIRGSGRGGRCSEFLLALARELDGAVGTWAIAADTDGIDGAEANAGAIVAPDTVARAAAAGIDARERLDDNDAWGFFHALGDLVVTGPTRTNVNDYRALMLLPAAGG